MKTRNDRVPAAPRVPDGDTDRTRGGEQRIGYARVSTRGQDLALQLEELAPAGVEVP